MRYLQVYNILLNTENLEKFRNGGKISIKGFDKSQITSFFNKLQERDTLIEYVFADVIKNSTSEFLKSLIEQIAKTALILPLDIYEKDIREFKQVKRGTCILQLNKNVKAENIFREEEILTSKDYLERFSQISRTVKYDNNNVHFVKMHAILKVQNKTFAIQMVYTRPGETKFYKYENEFVFFVHPVCIDQIIVNDTRIMVYDIFKNYFSQKYEIEKTYSEQEQERCKNFRLSYSYMSPKVTNLYTVHHAISVEDFKELIANNKT